MGSHADRADERIDEIKARLDARAQPAAIDWISIAHCPACGRSISNADLIVKTCGPCGQSLDVPTEARLRAADQCGIGLEEFDNER